MNIKSRFPLYPILAVLTGCVLLVLWLRATTSSDDTVPSVNTLPDPALPNNPAEPSFSPATLADSQHIDAEVDQVDQPLVQKTDQEHPGSQNLHTSGISRKAPPQNPMPIAMQDDLNEIIGLIGQQVRQRENELAPGVREDSQAVRKPLPDDVLWAISDLSRALDDSLPYRDQLLSAIDTQLQDILDIPYQSARSLSDRSTQQPRTLRDDLMYELGKIWGSEDPTKHASYLQSQGLRDGPEAEGWLFSQLINQTYQNGMMERHGFKMSPEAIENVIYDGVKDYPLEVMESLLDLRSSTVSGSNFAPLLSDEGYSELLSQGFANARNLSDATAVEFLEEVQKYLSDEEYGNTYRRAMLAIRSDLIEDVYLPPDKDAFMQLSISGEFPEAAELLSSVSPAYEGIIDHKLAQRLIQDWAKVDPAATFAWMDRNVESIPRSELIIAGLFRRWGEEDPTTAFAAARTIADPVLHAYALSNIIIPNAEKDPASIAISSISSMPPGFIKARSIAGYILGVSRSFDDEALEITTKRQFMKNAFDLQALDVAIGQANLPAEVVELARSLIYSYE